MTTRPGSETTDLVVGDRVRCQRTEPRRGTWGRYEGREGTVVSLNRQTFPDGTTYVEIGVTFQPAATADSRHSAEVWFRADELVSVAAAGAPPPAATATGTKAAP